MLAVIPPVEPRHLSGQQSQLHEPAKIVDYRRAGGAIYMEAYGGIKQSDADGDRLGEWIMQFYASALLLCALAEHAGWRSRRTAAFVDITPASSPGLYRQLPPVSQ